MSLSPAELVTGMEVLGQTLAGTHWCRSDDELLAPLHPLHPPILPSLFGCPLPSRSRMLQLLRLWASRQPFPTLPNPRLQPWLPMPPPKVLGAAAKISPNPGSRDLTPDLPEKPGWRVLCKGWWVWHGGGGASMEFGCPQVPCFACHPSSRAGWMDFVFAKGFGALWPHPARSAPSGIAGVRCPWRAGQHPQVLVGPCGLGGVCVCGLLPPHAPAVCVFRGKNPPLASFPPSCLIC